MQQIKLFFVLCLFAIFFIFAIKLPIHEYKHLGCQDIRLRYVNKTLENNKASIKAPELPDYYPNLFPVESFTYADRKNSTWLPRVITIEEHKEYMHLIQLAASLLGKHNITYMAFAGSMLGSWRHWDIVPWDDDFDILASLDDFERVVSILNDTNIMSGQYQELKWTWGLNVIEYPNKYIKLYLSTSKNDYNKKYEYKWPFLDLFFYTTDGKNLKYMKKKRSKVTLDSIFPLSLRPMGPFWLPMPAKPYYFFQNNYGNVRDYCGSGSWNHKLEKSRKKNFVCCASLVNHYEFVDRSCNGTVCIESLYRGDLLLGRIEFNYSIE